MNIYDVVILGGGPAGLAASLSAHGKGARVLVIEREKRLGGILKQCIHDGFGLITFKERLSGPEYAEKYIKMINEKHIEAMTYTFVTDVKKEDNIFKITLVNSKKGIFEVQSKAVILASGCRERTARQVFINGTRPAGIFTAGTAQYLVNIAGYMPCKKCVILGSGDIGLIMARRLTLEGAQVIGVYEAKPTPSGLSRNIAQCLDDYSIPLHLSETVTRVFGDDRVEAVEISKVDEKMNPIEGTEHIVECDGVILSVGLIPENETAEMLGIRLDSSTKGPYVDQNFMTLIDGVFSCGNALHVNDLVDYVSESGQLAGACAADYALNNRKSKKNLIEFKADRDKFLYAVPQYIDTDSPDKKATIYFRSRNIEKNVKIQLKYGDNILFEKKYSKLKPPEMERIQADLSSVSGSGDENVILIMQEL